MMIGTVMSFNSRERNGVIREDSTNKIFYFDRTQIERINLVQFQKVNFFPFTNQHGEKVAINVQPYHSSNSKQAVERKPKVDPTKDIDDGGRVLARVKFFDNLKGYGFLACETEPPTDAYLHINELRKGGYESIQNGRVIMVRLRQGRPGKCPLAYDIKVPRANDQVNKLPPSKLSDNKSKATKSTMNSYRDPAKKREEKTVPKVTQARLDNNPQRKITEFTVDVEVQKLEGDLKRKKNLLKSVNLQKIPDGGQRLYEQIDQLEGKLTKLKEQLEKKKEDQSENETMSAKDKIMDAFERSLKNMNISGSDRGEADGDHNRSRENWFGKELSDASRVTNKAIEKLHHSLKSCPPTSTELSDPEGLLVTLMKHQKQALAWMQWRESQEVSGGILADDMGLGKTLTMIAIILVQLQEEKEEEKVKADDDSESTTEEESKEKSDEKSDGEEDDEKSSDDDEEKKLLKTSSTLIVAPASLIYHWKNEILNRCKEGLLSVHLFHGPKREKDARKLQEFDVVITTYDLVRRSYCPTDKKEDKKKTKKKATESTLFDINWRRIILDEAHQIKNYKSQQSNAACAVRARSRWAMSGTPIQNSETDLFAMLRFLHCSPFDEYKLWKNDVGTRTQQGNKRIKTLVSCFILRRTKAQKDSDGKALVILPDRKFLTHEIRLDEYELKVYRKLQSDSRTSMQKYSDARKKGQKKEKEDDDEKEGKKLTVTHLLVMLLRLRQCCCHLSLLQNVVDPDTLENDKTEFALEDLFKSMSLSKSDGQSHTSVMHGLTKFDKEKNFEKTSSSSKIQLMLDLLKKIRSETPRDKCVIISQWTKFLSIVEYHLKEESISYATIDGSVSASKRMDLVDEFNNNPIKPKVMLISLQAGGVGLNLVGANHLLMLDMHWNPALEQQAFDRIYRVGQKKEVFVHKFVVMNTVEEKILKLQTDKLKLASVLLEGASSENKVHKLTLDDMKNLFGL